MEAEYKVELHDKNTWMHGFLVVHSTARGPGKGGIRFVPNLTLNEVQRLAEAMSYKNALAELPFGGAKAGIAGSPAGASKPKLIRAFSRMIKEFVPELYIPGPDMNMSEKDMAIVADEVGLENVTGKPFTMGGLPHEIGTTGFGVIEAMDVALKFKGMETSGSTVAIEGFGVVGKAAVRRANELGAKVVAVSDSQGAIYNENGINAYDLEKAKREKGSVVYCDGKKLPAEELFGLDVDVLIPGARPNVINENNYEKVRARIIVEAANIPVPYEIEKKLHQKGVLIVPDIIANAGGVITSYAELKGKTIEETFELVKDRVRRNTDKILERGGFPRDAAIGIAVERIEEAEKARKA
ncbi:MAG: Glu/Leu/Phe/Val dehydrogenase [Candidatus Anstonellales archaeon]